MQIKIFTIPIIGGNQLNDEMNTFLRSKKVLAIESRIIEQEQGSFWSFCIKYIEGQNKSDRGREKVDYKQILDEESFQRFSGLREIRKRIAKEEAIPAYAVFTDKELAALARIEDGLTISKMKTIKGIGEKKVEKYASHFINTTEQNEES